MRQTGTAAPKRRWLPACDACGHPYAEHAIGDTRNPGDCFACPERCDYKYPPPTCGGCGKPIKSYLTEADDAAWHSTCWYREERARELVRRVYDGWEPPGSDDGTNQAGSATG